MKTTRSFFISVKQFFVYLAVLTLTSCGSFQFSSYYSNDGIYSTEKNITSKGKKNVDNNYYAQYFKNAAELGVLDNNSESIIFTDVDSYNSISENQEEVILNDFSQKPWGDETSQTEIILFNNRPNFMWGLSGFAFNNSPFWNGFYSNPYRFGYGRFYNPWFYDSFLNPFGGFAGMWGGFDPFYSPFGFGGFYNPYGYGFGYRNRFFNRWPYGINRWNRFNDYYGNDLRRRNSSDYRSTIARIKSGRGEKTYNNSSDIRRRERSNNKEKSSQNIQNTLNRINVGRGASLVRRNSITGYDRNRIVSSQMMSSNSIRNLRPGLNLSTANRNLGLLRNNTNINKNSLEDYGSTGRLQSRYSLIRRNPNQNNVLLRRSGRSNEVQTARIRSNEYKNRSQQINKESNGNQRNNYNISSRSNNSGRSYSRSYNSGSRPSFNSGSGRSSSGRGSSSSSAGRRN